MWHFKLFVRYSNYLNSLDQIALFGIRIQSVFKTQIYSVFSIQCIFRSRIYSVFDIRSKLSIWRNTDWRYKLLKFWPSLLVPYCSLAVCMKHEIFPLFLYPMFQISNVKKGQSYVLVTRISKVPTPSLDTLWWNFPCTQTFRKKGCEDRGVLWLTLLWLTVSP